ncbi:MAG TPA: DUF3367 domain-containing protein, partial [Acidimicrobiia bacterium]|nr:DUF3367 domain-containing protein [Acidimicrobiia bacterium]
EVALATPPNAPEPPPVSVFDVKGTQPIVHTDPATRPLIVAGDGEGLVDLAILGALDPSSVVLYSGSFAHDPSALRREIAQPGSVLVVTDSNRKRGRRWGSIKDVEGPTERVDETSLSPDEGDARLDVFPGSGPDAQTVVQSPGAEVSTTGIGNVITYWPEMRGSRAFDGNLDTAWEVGDHGSVIGQKIRLDLAHPITTDRVNLVQPQVGPNARFITKVTLTFDDGHPVTVELHDASRTPAGETVQFPRRTFHRLEITVDDTNVGDTFDYPTSNNVGFAEIRLRDEAPGARDVRVGEIVRMPTDLVDAAGSLAETRPLVYEMSRSRNVVIPPRYSQDEEAIVRKLLVPGGRDFSLGGTVRLATAAPDDVLDTVLGIPGAAAGGITVRASQHLPGDVSARGSAAFDGDPATAWNTAFGDPTGQWVEVQTPAPETFDHLDLSVVADGRHSVPTQLRIDAGGESRTVDLPPVADRATPNATTSVPVSFPALTGDDVRVTISAVRPVTTIEYHENQPIVMPVGIAEVGLPGVTRPPVPTQLPSECRSDLLQVDGTPVPIRLLGDTASALRGDAVDFEPCGGALSLTAGNHLVRSAPGTVTGIDVDGVVLGSDAGGAPMTLGPGGSLAPVTQSADRGPSSGPAVRVVQNGRTKQQLEIRGAQPGVPFWLVLGESNSEGWRATVAGTDAGQSTLVDGYANGWRIVPTSANFAVTLEWTPQRDVWVALAISAAALLACIVLACWPRRRARDDVGDVGAAIDGEVTLGNPLVAHGTTPRWRVVVVAVVVAGLGAAFVSRWWIGAVVGAAALLVLLRPRWRVLLTLGAVACVAGTGLYVLVQEHRYRYPYDFFWVDHFSAAANVAWLAVLLLAADALVEVARSRRTSS